MTGDFIEATGIPGMVHVQTRTGWKGLLNIDQIDHVFPRREGGAALKIDGVRTLLLSTPFDVVVKALRDAANGGPKDD